MVWDYRVMGPVCSTCSLPGAASPEGFSHKVDGGNPNSVGPPNYLHFLRFKMLGVVLGCLFAGLRISWECGHIGTAESWTCSPLRTRAKKPRSGLQTISAVFHV